MFSARRGSNIYEHLSAAENRVIAGQKMIRVMEENGAAAYWRVGKVVLCQSFANHRIQGYLRDSKEGVQVVHHEFLPDGGAVFAVGHDYIAIVAVGGRSEERVEASTDEADGALLRIDPAK